MSTEPGSAKARRKLATYGRSAHKEGYDFDVPDSPERSDDGGSFGQANRARLHSTASRPSKPTQMSRSPKRPSQRQGAGPSTERSTAAPSVGPMLSSFSDPPGDDLFDVPSSDNDDSKAVTTPFKPAIKRRKIPGKDDNGTLTAASEAAIERTPRREEARKKPPRETISQTPPPKILSHLLKKQGPSRPSWRESNKLSTSTETSDMEGATKRSREGATANRPGARLNSPLHKDHPRPSSQPGDRVRSVAQGDAKPGPHHAQLLSTTSMTRKGPKSEPKTPPSERAGRRYLTPDGDVEPAQGSAFSYMSPSGLDFLGLDIAETPEGRTPHTFSQTSNSLGQRLASPGRIKLKDRLARRDGAFEPPPTSDPTTSGRVENIPSDGEDAGSPAAQKLVEKRNDDMMDTLPSSSQVEVGSTPRVTYGGGPRHTYAASNRTLRKDENATEDDMFASLVDVQETTGSTARRIRVDVQPKIVQDSERDAMDFDETDEEQPSALRNIHELRQAGANAQLHGETEALLDEVESSNTSTTRSGLVGLLRKLDDTAFRDKFAAGGLDGRLISRIDPQLDLLSSALLSMALLQLLAEHSNSQTLLAYQRSSTTPFLKTVIAETDTLRSIARNRKSNVSKALQQEVEQICQTFLKSSLWKFGTPPALTPRIVALHLAEGLARYTRGTGILEELLPANIMDLFVELLASHSEDSEDKMPELRMLESRVLLAVLESATIGNGNDNLWRITRWRSKLLETLSELLVSAAGWHAKEHTEILSHLLRLGLNLTNNDIEACTVFARSEVLQSVTTGIEEHFAAISSENESPVQSAVVDNLILSLGFLINLAEHSRPARELFSQSISASWRPLDTLLRIFSTKWMKAFEVTSEQESRDSVPLGYLAVLLAFLCIEDTNRTYVASKLAGGSLKHLLIAVDAFLSYHRKVAEELQGSEEGAEIKAHFIERVQVVLNQLKQSEP